jgi:hypothetical protein
VAKARKVKQGTPRNGKNLKKRLKRIQKNHEILQKYMKEYEAC